MTEFRLDSIHVGRDPFPRGQNPDDCPNLVHGRSDAPLVVGSQSCVESHQDFCSWHVPGN